MKHWKLESNYLVFEPTNYEIPLHYISTPERLIVWVECLNEKRWTTPEIIEEFAAIALDWINNK